MSQRTPTLNDIRWSLFYLMQEIVAEEEADERVVIVPPQQEGNPEITSMLLISGFQPGLVEQAELGGYGALAVRRGIWKMTISSHKNSNAGEPWLLAEKLEAAFRKFTVDGIPIHSRIDPDGISCPIFCDFPYTENVGITPDERNALSVTVPWWTWTQN